MSDMYDKKTRQPINPIADKNGKISHVLAQVHKVRDDGSIDVGSPNELPTLTQQQFKDECDVNNIMRQYTNTGEIYHLNRKEGVYADMAGFTDYQEMLHAVMEAQDRFASLPAEVRKYFDNDPQKMIAFLGDSKNYDEAARLGLVEKKNAPTNTLNNDDLTTIKTLAKELQNISTQRAPASDTKNGSTGSAGEQTKP